MFESHLTYVAAQIKLRVVLPTGKAESERRGHDAFEIARQKRQFRFDELQTVFEQNLTLENADAGHIERHPFPLQMQEDGVTPGKAVTLLVALHDRTPIQLRDKSAPQFTKVKRCASFTSLSTL